MGMETQDHLIAYLREENTDMLYGALRAVVLLEGSREISCRSSTWLSYS